MTPNGPPTAITTPTPPRGAGRLLVIAGLLVAVGSGCNSVRKLTAVQSPPDITDPETGKPMVVAELESDDADRLRKQSSNSLIDDHIRRGDEAIASLRFEEARRHYRAVLAAEPQNGTAHHRLAVCADNLEEFTQAEEHYRTALQQMGEDATILSDLGFSYILQDRFDEAEDCLKRARNADPKYDNAIGNMGLLYAKKGDRERSLAIYGLLMSEAEAIATVDKLLSARGPAAAPVRPAAPVQTVQAETAERGSREPSAALASEMARLREEITKPEEDLIVETMPAATFDGHNGFEATLSPRSLADIGHVSADQSRVMPPGDDFDAFMAASEPATAAEKEFESLPSPNAPPVKRAIGRPRIEPWPGHRVAEQQPSTNLSQSIDPAARHEAAMLGLGFGSAGGWTLLAASDADPAGENAGISSAPLAEATFGAAPSDGATLAADSLPQSAELMEPPRYDPSASQAGFDDGFESFATSPAIQQTANQERSLPASQGSRGPVINSVQPIPIIRPGAVPQTPPRHVRMPIR